MTTAELEYIIKVQDRDLKDLKKTLTDTNKTLGDTSGATKGASGFSKLSKAAGIASLAIGGGLAIAAKIGFGEMMEGQKVAAQTEAVLKSTSGAAKVTADHVNDLAGALLKKSGVDDEVIASGENVILTFTGIRNEAGKNNDIFDQAVKGALDYSVAMGKDMPSSALLLSKALNNPIDGMNKLTKAGVVFTEQQKEQIKTMVKHGDTVGAQRVILGEWNKEFGGSAEAAGKTLAGQLNIAKESFNNLAGSIAQAVLPALTLFAQELGNVATFLTEHQTTAKILVGVLGGLAVVLGTVAVATKLYAAGQVIAQAATAAWTAAQWLLNAALTGNPIGIVVVAIAALVAAVIVAYRESETFRNIVQAAMNGVKVAAQAVATFFTGTVVPAVRSIITAAQDLWAKLDNVLIPVFHLVIDVARTLANFYKNVLVTEFNILKGVIQTVITIVDNLRNAFQRVYSIVSNIASFISGTLATAWTTLKEGAGAAATFVSEKVTPVLSTLKGVFDGIMSALKWIGEKGLNAFEKLWNASKGFLSNLAAALGPINSVIGGISGGISSIIDNAQSFANAISKIAGAASGAAGLVGKVGGFFRAKGGPVSAGEAYIVGEKGMELFVPGTDGRIIPNNALSQPNAYTGGGTTASGGTNVFVNVEGTVISEFDLAETVRRELLRVQSRNVSTGIA